MFPRNDRSRSPFQPVSSIRHLLHRVAHPFAGSRDGRSEGEERFHAVFGMAAVAISQVSISGRWLRFNSKLCELTGYSEEELLRRTWQEITHPDDLPLELELRKRLIAGEADSYAREKRYIRKDGSPVWVGINVTLVRGTAGQPKYYIAIIQDLSQRTRAEAAYRDSEARLRLALDAADMGTWERDLANDKEIWSDTHESLFGLAAGTFEGTHKAFLRLVHADDRPVVEAAARRAVNEHESYRCEYRAVWPDGSLHWLVGRGDVLRDACGQATHIIGVTRETTERKLAEIERSELLRASSAPAPRPRRPTTRRTSSWRC